MKVMVSALSLCLLLLLAGCGAPPPPYESPYAKEYGYFTYPGTDWGMTEEEFLSAMGMELADFQTADHPESDLRFLATELDFAGKACQTCFHFVTRETADGGDTSLLSVQFRYPAESPEDFYRLCDELDAIINPQEAETTASVKLHEKKLADDTCVYPVQPEFETAEAVQENYSYSIKSTATMTALPQEVQDAYNSILQERLDTVYKPQYEENPDDPLLKFDERIDLRSFNFLLSHASVSYIENHSDKSTDCTVLLSGRGMEQIHGLIRAYDPKAYAALFGAAE